MLIAWQSLCTEQTTLLSVIKGFVCFCFVGVFFSDGWLNEAYCLHSSHMVVASNCPDPEAEYPD